MSVDLKYDCECLCSLYCLSREKYRLELCISGWSGMWQPYIESGTTVVPLSDDVFHTIPNRLMEIGS